MTKWPISTAICICTACILNRCWNESTRNRRIKLYTASTEHVRGTEKSVPFQEFHVKTKSGCTHTRLTVLRSLFSATAANTHERTSKPNGQESKKTKDFTAYRLFGVHFWLQQSCYNYRGFQIFLSASNACGGLPTWLWYIPCQCADGGWWCALCHLSFIIVHIILTR